MCYASGIGLIGLVRGIYAALGPCGLVYAVGAACGYGVDKQQGSMGVALFLRRGARAAKQANNRTGNAQCKFCGRLNFGVVHKCIL